MEQLTKDVKSLLNDPLDLCSKLGLLGGHQRQASGVLIRCPFHGEKNPSCSVTLAKGGTIRVKCFACDAGGDALTLISQVRGLALSGPGFVDTLAEAAEIAGSIILADEIRGGRERVAIARPEPARVRVFEDEAEYPPIDDVKSLWRNAEGISLHQKIASILLSRQIDPGAVEDAGVMRVLADCATVPRWASFRGVPWTKTHRGVIPTFDSCGDMRSVRAWRTSGDGPKRLPPAGHKAAGLVLANREAVAMLRGKSAPKVVYVVEGEPDFLIATTDLRPSGAVFGVGSGAWTPAFAKAIDRRSRVIVATHGDRAGEKYAADIFKTLEKHPYTWRWTSGPK